MSNFASERNEIIEFCYSFWEKFGYLGLICWNITLEKITFGFHFNSENINLGMMLYVLNSTLKDTPELLERAGSLILK